MDQKQKKEKIKGATGLGRLKKINKGADRKLEESNDSPEFQTQKGYPPTPLKTILRHWNKVIMHFFFLFLDIRPIFFFFFLSWY